LLPSFCCHNCFVDTSGNHLFSVLLFGPLVGFVLLDLQFAFCVCFVDRCLSFF
jgi:hypothetical protein